MASTTSRAPSARLTTVLAGVLAVTVEAAGAAGPTVTGLDRLRPADEGARALIDAAVAASPTVAGLLEDIAASDVIVSVQVRVGLEYAGHLAFAARTPCFRLVVVRVSAAQSRADQVAMLGHELQHAREVAQAREVQDEAGLSRLMRRIGVATGAKTFETDAAVAVANQVRRDLARR